MKMCTKVIDIIWDTDGNDVEDLYLPHTTHIPSNIEEEEIADFLSEKYGFLVISFKIE